MWRGRQEEPVTLQRVSGAHSDRTTSGGHRRLFGPGSFGRWLCCPIRRTRTCGEHTWQLKMLEGTGATPKGQCRLGRPYDSWRAPTPFWSGRLFNEAVDSHWRRMTTRDALECFKWKGRLKCEYKCRKSPVRQCDSGSAQTILVTGRLWKSTFAIPWKRKTMDKV